MSASTPVDGTAMAGLRAIVTGGSSGIGAEVVAAFARRGLSTVSLDLECADETSAVDQLEVDVRDRAAVAEAVTAAAERLGGLDVVVNNAGIGASGTVVDNDDDEWHRVLDVNVVGMARVSAAALPHLRRSDHASIVNVCSIAATAGLPQRALYSASKGAVLSLTLAMAADHIREGIRVNCVNPGTVDTPWVTRLLEAADDPQAERRALEARQPSGRLVAPAEVAAVVCLLADPAAGALTGASIAVDGGMQGLRLRPDT